MNTVQTILNNRIAEKRISLREAARQIGVSNTTITRILNGGPYDVKTLQAVSAWAEIPVSVLLDSADDSNLASKLAAMIQAEPHLAAVFNEALDRILRGEMSAEVLSDIVSYASFRMGARDGNR